MEKEVIGIFNNVNCAAAAASFECHSSPVFVGINFQCLKDLRKNI
jgi:hypothetical protein